MSQEIFIEKRESMWQLFAEQVKYLSKSNWARKKDDGEPDQLDEFPYLLRQVCHHLALAKDRLYSPQLITRLNDLALDGHAQLYKKKGLRLDSFIRFLFIDFPCLLREQKRIFFLALGLFFLPLFIMASVVYSQPDLIYSLMSDVQVEMLEEMYDKDSKKSGRPRGSETDFQMFGLYVFHNVGISFRTFAGGILFGLGAVFFLSFNGVMIGAISGYLLNAGHHEKFLSFVVGHGSFELLGIAISGCAGLMLGVSIIKPNNLSRIESLKRAAKKAVVIMYGVLLMLLVAAFIEAFWSSTVMADNTIKYVVGLGFWGMLILFFTFSGRSYGLTKD